MSVSLAGGNDLLIRIAGENRQAGLSGQEIYTQIITVYNYGEQKNNMDNMGCIVTMSKFYSHMNKNLRIQWTQIKKQPSYVFFSTQSLTEYNIAATKH